MPKILRTLLYLALIFFVIFLLSQPYNWFCHSSGKCDGIYLSDFAIEKEGEYQIITLLEVKNYRTDISFEAKEPRLIYTTTGKKNVVNYQIRNLTNTKIKFRPKFYIEPKQFDKYLIRRDCLCFREYNLDAGETLDLHSIFKFDSTLELDPEFNKNGMQIRIGYEARP